MNLYDYNKVTIIVIKIYLETNNDSNYKINYEIKNNWKLIRLKRKG